VEVKIGDRWIEILGGGNNAFPVIRQYQGMPSEGAHVLSSVYVLKTDWFLKVFEELPFG
jgi:hypothetical protein